MWLNCLKAIVELCSGVSYCDNEMIRIATNQWQIQDF